jgi:hypothetical protein
MRAVYLKGTTIAELGFDYIALAVIGILFSTAAMFSYRKQE